MATGHVFIATSLDGFIARKDHALDWLPQEPIQGEDHGYETFIASVDGLVMGSNSFKNVLTFGLWPYAKPVIVMSQTLKSKDIPKELEGKVRITDFTPKELMQMLSEEGWRRVYIDGGKIVQSFLKEGLICDMIISTIPILIGKGCGLFGELNHDIQLKLTKSKAFTASGIVQNHYQIIH